VDAKAKSKLTRVTTLTTVGFPLFIVSTRSWAKLRVLYLAFVYKRLFGTSRDALHVSSRRSAIEFLLGPPAQPLGPLQAPSVTTGISHLPHRSSSTRGGNGDTKSFLVLLFTSDFSPDLDSGTPPC